MSPSADTVSPLGRLAGRRVLVIGDVMLDRFVWGEVQRISPEAPVPVVKITREADRVGGAANVAANLAALGADARLIGVTGEDAEATALRAALDEHGVTAELIRQADCPTTVKTRVVARAQQVVRVDREHGVPPDEATRAGLRAALERNLSDIDALVVSDYRKGVVHPELLAAALPTARRLGVPVVVDPKPAHLECYQPITVVTPNVGEAEGMAGIEIRTDEDCERAARTILDRIDTRAVLITRGERGMLLVEREGEPRAIPTRARQVYDVTGAGDTVVATLALALAAGADLYAAAGLAALAAGLVVVKVGTATVGLEELKNADSSPA